MTTQDTYPEYKVGTQMARNPKTHCLTNQYRLSWATARKISSPIRQSCIQLKKTDDEIKQEKIESSVKRTAANNMFFLTIRQRCVHQPLYFKKFHGFDIVYFVWKKKHFLFSNLNVNKNISQDWFHNKNSELWTLNLTTRKFWLSVSL